MDGEDYGRGPAIPPRPRRRKSSTDSVVQWGTLAFSGSVIKIAPQRQREVEALRRREDKIVKVIDIFGEKILELENIDGFSEEFQTICNEEDDNFDPRNCSIAKQFRKQNRYQDILPYNDTVVDVSKGYVNASFIRNLLPGSPLYIASQGPLPHTCRLFWRMIVEKNCKNIVMVTNIVESDMLKCAKYWPEIGKTVTCRGPEEDPVDYVVIMEEEHLDVAWSIRTLQVTEIRSGVKSEPKQVKQYHFTDWPDHGAPLSAQAFVDFVRVVMAAQEASEDMQEEPAPLLVHCSAGVGRTGTFICCYSILASLQYVGDKVHCIDVFAVVRRLRRMRMSSVQSLRQYEFLCNAVFQAADQYYRAAINAPNPHLQKKLSSVSIGSHKSRRSSTQSALLNGVQMLRLNGAEESVTDETPRVYEYDELVKMITAPSLDVLEGVVDDITRKDLDTLVHVAFKTFGADGTLLPLVARVAEWEVKSVESEKIVFRRNSFASKLITACLEAYGQGYRRKTIRPLIEMMLETVNVSYEINPNLIQPGENMGENRHTLRRLGERFLSHITSTLPSVPVAVQLVCYGVALATAKRFPDARLIAVAGAFFLRFFIPAILSPKAHGIYEEDLPPKIKRGLCLIGKMLQSVANSNKFNGFREEFMQPMNNFVKLAQPRGEEFLKRVCMPPKALSVEILEKFKEYDVPLRTMIGDTKDKSIEGKMLDCTIGGGILREEMTKLHSLLHERKLKIGTLLHTSDSVWADKFTKLMNDLKEPGAIKPPEVWLRKQEKVIFEREVTERENVRRVSWHLSSLEEDIMIAEEQEYYPDSKIKRATIRAAKWNVLDPGYSPVEYTTKNVLDAPKWADPDVKTSQQVIPLTFNSFDDAFNVDRTSYAGRYKVVNGIPCCPEKRTGITGRGALGRWGPNHISEPIITRAVQGKGGGPLLRGELPVYEILVGITDNGMVLPGDFIRERHEIIPEFLQEMFGENPCHSSNEKLKQVFNNGLDVYKGFVDDNANTDNAWIETKCVSFHDDCGAFDNIVLKEGERFSLAWKQVNEDLQLTTRTLSLVHQAANIRKAFFADKIPILMRALLPVIEEQGLFAEGLYRVSGSALRIKALRETCFDDDFDMAQTSDIHDLTGFLKQLLREMNPPLLTFDLYNQFVEAGSIRDEERRYMAVAKVVTRLPPSHARKVAALLRHLKRVANECATNKMTIDNLALVFGPTIMRSPGGLPSDLTDSGHQIKVAKVLLTMDGKLLDQSLGLSRLRTVGFTVQGEHLQFPAPSKHDANLRRASENLVFPDAGSLISHAAPRRRKGTTRKRVARTSEQIDEILEPTPINPDLLEDVDEKEDGGYDVVDILDTSVEVESIIVVAEDEDLMVPKEVLSMLENELWFELEASREDIRNLRTYDIGTFIVHPSKTHEHCYCMSVWNGEYIWTGLIQYGPEGFNFEDSDRHFEALSQLVEYFQIFNAPCGCKLDLPSSVDEEAAEREEEETENAINDKEEDDATKEIQDNKNQEQYTEYYEGDGSDQATEQEEVALVDEHGEPLQEEEEYEGYYVNENGQYVDEEGNLMDEDGNYVDKDGSIIEYAEEYGEEEYAEGDDNAAVEDEEEDESAYNGRPSREYLQTDFSEKRRSTIDGDLNDEAIRKEGWLSLRLKQGKLRGKGMKRKWFILKDTMLKYYKAEGAESQCAQGHFNISPDVELEPVRGGFALHQRNKNVSTIFIADTEEIAKEWLILLQKAHCRVKN